MTTPVGPYTPAMRAGAWLVCSGQIGIAPGPDGPVLADGLEAQTRQAMKNVADLLTGRGMRWENVVKTTVFLADIGDYAAFNEVYVEMLGRHRPARSVVGVAGLPLGARVEIEAWAYAER
ncbi:MAG TPA: Rid family detoxifying hydrolase [Acidimicrobiales bacterium]|nr:Rid family detoxifying hydrolase [Acidimicrobiales bacterium]